MAKARGHSDVPHMHFVLENRNGLRYLPKDFIICIHTAPSFSALSAPHGARGPATLWEQSCGELGQNYPPAMVQLQPVPGSAALGRVLALGLTDLHAEGIPPGARRHGWNQGASDVVGVRGSGGTSRTQAWAAVTAAAQSSVRMRRGPPR